jgi:hypothetical protein
MSSSCSGRMALRGCSPTRSQAAGSRKIVRFFAQCRNWGPDDAEGVAAFVAGQAADGGEDVLSGHLPQMA